MLQLFREKPPAIGLDVGSESIKLLQLAAGPNGLAVTGAMRVIIPDDVKGDPDKRVVFAGETVRSALRSKTFRGRRITAALPKELVHYKTHRLPLMSADELQMAARIDARDLFRFDPDSADVQCIDAGKVQQGESGRREVILIAAGKQYINDFILSLHRAGAVVGSLGIDPCAIWRAGLVFDTSAGTEPRVLLDFGAAQSRVVIGQGEQIRVVKTIDVGADQFRTAISRKLGLSVAEVEQLRRRAMGGSNDKLESIRRVLHDTTRHSIELLAREVQASVRYHATTFRGPEPRRIELVGGEAGDPQIRSALSTLLGLPAEPLDIFRGIDTAAIPPADNTESLGEWAVALGLALRGMPEEVSARRSSIEPRASAPISELKLGSVQPVPAKAVGVARA
jgi:type IV pilus assembly protein PilM